jgi:hypothetical protein
LIYIAQFKKDLAANKEPKPVSREEAIKYILLPIPTNAMCLQCHGTSENINQEVQMKIKGLYQICSGCSENEVRGI